ncbi:MAG: ABC transporter substrate-binding protein, partial [Proteobacteria bacterium]|nr:ABC transporter substrate-binding protein [Pseudomonadota bacterium]
MPDCVSATDPGAARKGRGAVSARGRLCGLLPLLLAACAPAASEEVTTAHPTIVSLNPCADAILAEVADPAQILALSHYSTDPRSASMPVAEARRFRTTRGTVEEVVALHPDMVIEGSFVAPATAGAYQRLGLRLETVGSVSSVDETRAQVRKLAALAGHPDRGESLIARMDAALAAAAPPHAAAPIPAVMWESGGMV